MCGSTIAGPRAIPSDLRKHAAELVALAPDVILASGTVTRGGRCGQATRTVPIVFVNVTDPVGAGFVASLAGRAATPPVLLIFEYSFGAKWLELLKQIAPSVTRVAVLRDPANPAGVGQFAAIQAVGAVARDGGEPGQQLPRQIARSSAPSRLLPALPTGA